MAKLSRHAGLQTVAIRPTPSPTCHHLHCFAGSHKVLLHVRGSERAALARHVETVFGPGSESAPALLRQILAARSIVEVALRPLELTGQVQLCSGKRTGTALRPVLTPA